MPTLIVDDVHLKIPEWVTDLAAFRRWTDEPDFPEKGNIWWLCGDVWADMSKEQLFSHNDVRTAITSTLFFLVKNLKLGRVLSDGALITNAAADISGNPDLTFLSFEALADGTVRLIEGKSDGYTEVEGSPDMVLEILSDSSETKDREILFEGYFEAGVKEYWLVDARTPPLAFDILKRGPKGFVPTRKQAGWLKSTVFGKSFRLVQTEDQTGHPVADLEVR